MIPVLINTADQIIGYTNIQDPVVAVCQHIYIEGHTIQPFEKIHGIATGLTALAMTCSLWGIQKIHGIATSRRSSKFSFAGVFGSADKAPCQRSAAVNPNAEGGCSCCLRPSGRLPPVLPASMVFTSQMQCYGIAIHLYFMPGKEDSQEKIRKSRRLVTALGHQREAYLFQQKTRCEMQHSLVIPSRLCRRGNP